MERASTHAYRFRASHQHISSRALHSSALAAGDVDGTPDFVPAFIVPASSFWEAAVPKESSPVSITWKFIDPIRSEALRVESFVPAIVNKPWDSTVFLSLMVQSAFRCCVFEVQSIM